MGNVLLQLPNIDHLSTQQLYDEFGSPDLEPVVRADKQPLASSSIPPYVYSPIWLGKPGNEMLLPEVKLFLADFGTAFCASQESVCVLHTSANWTTRSAI